MTFEEAQSCFDKEILGLWTDWKPNDKERSLWILSIQRFTDADVKKATFRYAQNYELYKKPKLPLLLTIMGNVCRKNGKKQYIDAPCLFWLIRERDGAMKAIYGVTGREYMDEGIRKLAAAISKRYSPDYQGDNWNPLFSRDESEHLNYPFGKFPIKVQKPVITTVFKERIPIKEMTKDLFRPDKKIDDIKPATEYRPNPDWVGENPPPPEDGDIPF